MPSAEETFEDEDVRWRRIAAVAVALGPDYIACYGHGINFGGCPTGTCGLPQAKREDVDWAMGLRAEAEGRDLEYRLSQVLTPTEFRRP